MEGEERLAKKTPMDKLAKILVIPAPARNHGPPTDQSIEPVDRERRARWVALALIVGALGLFWAGAFLAQHEDTAGLRDLPAEARHDLYTRTLSELETICRDPAAATGALRDHCVAQATFVLQLPECTGDCPRIAAAVLPHARR